VLFRLDNAALVVALTAIVTGTTVAGTMLGRRLRELGDDLSEPVGALQGALLGFVGLLLAFGLTMAVGRYESRRSAIVDEANSIGTAFLRSETIPEPQRSTSIELFRAYAAERLQLASEEIDSAAFRRSVETSTAQQRDLWRLAGEALDRSPDGSAVRLYVESLNTMFDSGAEREAAFRDRVPTSVVVLEIGGAALALGVLGLYLSTLGRRIRTPFLAAVMVSLILIVALDLDRPRQGFVRVPTTPLRSVVDETLRGPAAAPPADG